MIDQCACPSWDGTVCIAIRYNVEIEDVDEPCECYCHQLAERRFGWREDSGDDWDDEEESEQ